MIHRMEARVSTRGRVTIPIELRRRLGIKPGTKLIVREEEGRIVAMTFAQYVHSLRGKYRGTGMMKRLREERARERETAKFHTIMKFFLGTNPSQTCHAGSPYIILS